ELRTSVIGNLPTPFLYCGRWGYYTDTTGRIFVRARTYRPVFTRWLTIDPLWPWESAYAYARSRPATLVDASGQGCSPCCCYAEHLRLRAKSVCRRFGEGDYVGFEFTVEWQTGMNYNQLGVTGDCKLEW